LAKNPFRVLMTDPQTAEQLAWMQSLANEYNIELKAPQTGDPVERQALLGEAEGLLVQHVPVTAEQLAAAPKLKVIQKLGGRRDNLDVQAAQAQGIAVALMPLPGSVAVAEHAMMLVLACAKRLVLAHHLTASGAYRQLGIEPKSTSEKSHGFQWMKIPDLAELTGMTIGIFGFGDIGTEIAKRARAFEMEIIYHKRSRLDPDLEKELGVSYVTKEDLLRQSDFLVMISPLTPETEKTIGAKELELMKRSAYIINVSRGGVIDESALAEALLAHRIAGAGLDVFVQEPVPFDHPFLTLDNVILTPHIAGGKGGARERQARAVLENLKRFVDKQPLKYQVV
jgi:lactate dehydrogenase-like 2-hydroxyacid dehydrogenase